MKNILLSIFVFLPCMAFCQINAVQLKKAVPDGRVDSVYNGIDLPQSFNGEGVIIGVTDWGFDYTHPVFYDVTMQNYRILRAWDQWRTAGPAPEGFNYGTEIVGQEQLLTLHCDTFNVYEYGYHGTHVASIAAGAGAGTEYRGVAPGSELLLCTFLVNEQAAIDAFRWMYNVARQEQKRLVINMSWGLYYMGYLDGTGPLAEAMEELSQQGVVFVTSAGNDGDVSFHVNKDFYANQDTLKSVVCFATGGEGHAYGQSLTMTNSPDIPFRFRFAVMNSSNQILGYSPIYTTANGVYSLDSSITVNGINFPYKVDIKTPSATSHRHNARLRIKQPAVNGYQIALMAVADSGFFHAWNVIELTNDVGNWGGTMSSNGLPGWTNGNKHYGIGAPTDVDCAISVAAHTARARDTQGQFYGDGNVADFSIYGPTIDGREKPEISAPGVNVRAALSSYTNQAISGNNPVEFNGRTYKFATLSGTSMSSPFVSGVAALILQANPYLTPAQVKEILMETAYRDEFTENAAEHRMGAGKVDAYHAVMRALELVGIEDHYVSESRYNVYPNPVTSTAYVVVESNENRIEAQVYDLSGRLLHSQHMSKGVNTIDMQQYAAGYYLLRLNDGKTIESKSLIINR